MRTNTSASWRTLVTCDLKRATALISPLKGAPRCQSSRMKVAASVAVLLGEMMVTMVAVVKVATVEEAVAGETPTVEEETAVAIQEAMVEITIPTAVASNPEETEVVAAGVTQKTTA